MQIFSRFISSVRPRVRAIKLDTDVHRVKVLTEQMKSIAELNRRLTLELQELLLLRRSVQSVQLVPSGSRRRRLSRSPIRRCGMRKPASRPRGKFHGFDGH